MPSDCARAWVASRSLRSLARVQTAAAKVTTALRFSAVIGNFPRAGATSDNGVHGLSKLGSETFFRWREEQHCGADRNCGSWALRRFWLFIPIDALAEPLCAFLQLIEFGIGRFGSRYPAGR
jgi:hypothetical protein